MPKKIIKFSKDYNDIHNIKMDFISENKKNLLEIKKINSFYLKQPYRKTCKLCKRKLKNNIFQSFKVNYKICNFCGHLNGLNQDTDKFINYLYYKDKGKNYSKNYLNDFLKRVKHIYDPKVKFLKKVIKNKFSILELGSGGGHFLKACEKNNIIAEGYEVNKKLVKLGKKNLKKNLIYQTDLKTIYSTITSSKSEVLAMIGVLEHLKYPELVFKNFLKSNLKYMYISVPTISLSVFLENSFQNVFPRQLSGGHTHLFSYQSIKYLEKKYKLKIIGEWWFGTDIADLYRSLFVSSNSNKKFYKKMMGQYFFNTINELQNILDKKKICSEVHLVFKK